MSYIPFKFNKPFKLNSREVILADCLLDISSLCLQKDAYKPGLFKLDIPKQTIKPWISYPTYFKPHHITLNIDKTNQIIHIFDGDKGTDRLWNLHQVNITNKHWDYLLNVNKLKKTLQGIIQSSICPFINVENKKSSIRMIATHYQLTDNMSKKEYSRYSVNCYQFNISNNNKTDLVRVNKSRNHYPREYMEDKNDKPWAIVTNHNQTKIYQIGNRGIIKITKNGDMSKICNPLGWYNYINGIKHVRSNTLIIFSEITKSNQQFIKIIDNLNYNYNDNNTNYPSMRISLIKAPFIADFHVVIAEDIHEEELTVFGYIRENIEKKYNLNVPQYLIKLIDEFYTKEIVLMFIRSRMYMKSVAFIKLNVDCIINDELAIETNKAWNKDGDKIIKEAFMN